MNMMKQSSVGVIFALGLVTLASGCAKDPNQPQNNQQMTEMTRTRNDFEREKDPPLNANTHLAAGQLAESQGNIALAAQQYKEALKLDEKNVPALYRLAVVHAELKEFEAAIGTWQRYIKLTNGAAAGYSNMGFAYELSGNTGAAETSYKKGIEKDPQNQACRVNYGLMLARLNRIDDAIAQLSSVLSEAEVHYNLASVYEQRGRNDLARMEYKKAVELDPDLHDAKTRLAALQ
jgi:tetratricopeptide (TPR) repeat protein